jgi:hypothetical protein
VTRPSSFEGFFAENRERLFRALWLVARDRHEAEEVAQEAFLKVWERWDRVGRVEGPAGVPVPGSVQPLPEPAKGLTTGAPSARSGGATA